MSPEHEHIDYAGRRFHAVANTSHGEVDRGTIFSYHQRDDIVWATYEGGNVRFGTLVATSTPDGRLDMRYSHVNVNGVLRTGACETTPEVLPDGRLRLHERWRWTDGSGQNGTSTLEELHAHFT